MTKYFLLSFFLFFFHDPVTVRIFDVLLSIICNQLLTFTLPWSSQDTGTIDFWSPTVLWTMFFFMSLSFFLLTLFWNLWIATGHKSMWIRRLAYFKILRTRLTMIGFTSELGTNYLNDPVYWRCQRLIVISQYYSLFLSHLRI